VPAHGRHRDDDNGFWDALLTRPNFMSCLIYFRVVASRTSGPSASLGRAPSNGSRDSTNDLREAWE